ncbi:MAG TPA: hypothetical protein DD471_06240 [Planctomycetes bacterium]|jgi:hypothetical protein|nr:hypothetical protein [Planctomycetota bacterium]
MKVRIAEENPEAVDLIAPNQPDASGIGVNYTEAYLKVIDVELEPGKKVACKRKGLMITLTIGEKSGEALMRYIEDGPDVKNILRRALEGAAENAGAKFIVEDSTIYLDI